jgi:hypothetical protein
MTGMARSATDASLLDLLPRPGTGGSAVRRAPLAALHATAGGDPRIVRALHWAQIPRLPSPVDPAPRRHSFDELAEMGRAARSWTAVFRQLKAEGLIEEQTLGQVVARWHRRPGPVSAAGREWPRAAPSLAPSRTGPR